MKTLSQNTTSSACAPETGLQQLVATIVPDEQRISFWYAAFWPHSTVGDHWSPGSSAGWTVCMKTTAVVSGICTP